MGSTGSGGRAPACVDVESRASGYPATEHAHPAPFSGCMVAIVERVAFRRAPYVRVLLLEELPENVGALAVA